MRWIGGRHNSGRDLVEYTLLLPLFLALLLGIIELTFVVWTYNTLAHAAREGARVGVVPARTEADILDAVLDRAVGLNLNPENVTIVRGNGGQGDEVKVVIDYDYSFVLGLIGAGSQLHMHTESTMHSE